MTRIPLRDKSGVLTGHTMIDIADLARVTAAGPWRLHRGTGYVRRGAVYLHRFLTDLQPGDGLVVDHINGDPLDNRRSNLRVCRHRENQQNRHTATGSSSHRGVYWHPRERRWIAKVMVDGRSVTLGRFGTEEHAAKAAADFRAQHMPFSQDAMRATEFVESKEKEAVNV